LNPSDIAIPIRKLFSRASNVNVVLAEVDQVDVKRARILYDGAWKDYDYIILACGAKHFYFGNNGWESVAPGLKNIEQATEIRRRILTAFELAEKESSEDRQKSLLTFAIVGGGPTGVELAGAIAEMAKTTLVDDYKKADLKQTKVYLIEAGERILAAFPESLSFRAEKDLADLGVEVLKQTQASGLSSEGLRAGQNWIECRTILWAAGVQPSSLVGTVESPKDSHGKLFVKSDLSLPANPCVFAVGDIAAFSLPDGSALPGVAPAAIQMGHFVGGVISSEVKGGARKSIFSYRDKGMMATIGRSRAVVSSGNFRLTGLVAWCAWVFIHVLYLMRFKNRFFVFLQWLWAYFSFGQGARLIVHKTWRFYSGRKLSYGEEGQKEGSDGRRDESAKSSAGQVKDSFE
ncbi:MAG: NAD(P)/FAD-dependent oxidoreductase, partial [Bdellovibrionales bacterium]|nr:NAD(P)/FAD-dependent oxidoreductase [Bdellovibrionales bacterium]